MSFQQQPEPFIDSVHRPALQHRITPRQQQKEMTEAQVIVPSMSAALVPPSSNPFAYYHAAAAAAAAGYYQLPPYMALPSQQPRQVVFPTPIHHTQHHPQQQHHHHPQQPLHHHHPSTQQHHAPLPPPPQQQQPAIASVHPPIHHTLENATITYDTVAEHSLQRDLVKDVFFSPAMAQDSVEPSSSGSSISSQSDSESDSSGLEGEQDILFSPHVSPSDLLQDEDPLFFIGLDFAEDETKKPALSLRQLSRKVINKRVNTDDLPTPPANDEYLQLGQDSLKRHRNNNRSTSGPAKKLKVMPSDKLTPPVSPGIEYFDDASAEESSDEDEDIDSQHDNSEQLVDPVFYNYHPQLSDFQLISQPDHGSDDNESTSSWEDIQQRIDMFDYGFDTDSTSDEEEEQEQIVLPKRRIVTREEKPKPKPKQQKKKDQIRKKQQKAEQQEQENIVPVHNGCVISQKKQSQEQSVESQQLDNHSLQHIQEQQPLDDEGLERADPRPTAHPTIYQKLTKQNVDWCRYCGTTEGVNWRPGPWGKRTLCNKHGCDYKGYGFACKLPRLDLTGFANEAINDRDRPVLQLFCSVCHRQESWEGNVLVRCEGCPKAMHQKCCSQTLTDDFIKSDEQWFCDASCHENARRKRIVVELPRKRLPLMCAPKNNASTNNSNTTSSTSLRSSTSS